MAFEIPKPRVIASGARSITLTWAPTDSEESLNVLPEDDNSHISYKWPPRYQLSKAEDDDPDFHPCYEGDDTTHEILDLKPETRYRIKLRVQEAEQLGGDWSRDYKEVEGKTTDETLSQKLTNQLFRAIASNDAVTVARIVSSHTKEVSLETRDRSGKTPLMNACQSASQDVVSMLLKAGASAGASTLVGKSALSIAVTYGNQEAVEAILNQSTETLEGSDQGGSTPLMWAAENVMPKHPKGLTILELLLAKGAKVDAQDMRHQTALDRLCATSGDAAAARLLLQHGARIIREIDTTSRSAHQPPQNMTTLMVAALNGHKALCDELMDNWDVDPTVQTEFGGTARSFAEQAGHTEVVQAIDAKVRKMRDAARKAIGGA
ncbi:ankyrin repeat-containing domain protein [Fimicolochytrium jonesii]|uniref:ankyrin repeat-containing domain protein n=1 Tax=Fimicolochytrium jonesii TaxID=1396493 RepID=UPI0022FDF710|nr:ankyrin repeat-containing domain protein [Fimicolochytrium jonesii]KAI8816339.1 ankyrin repeat-containing domain protein [Fimicolochytrium jonesii]